MSKEKQIEVITYEEDRLNYFTELMKKAQKRYLRLFKKYKNAPYLSEESQMLSDAGREAQFHGDVVEMLEKGYRKQSEWISVEERLPEHLEKVLVYDERGNMNTAMFLRYNNGNVDLCTSVRLTCQVTHWMPLPEAPKKGGGEE